MAQRSDASPRRRASLPQRIWRINLRWIGIALILLAAVLLDGRAPRHLLALALGRMVGADCTIDRLRLEGANLVARDVRFSAPYWQGPGAEVARVDTVRADVDWWSVLQFSPRLDALVLDGGRLQLVESERDPPTFNIGALRTIRTPRAAEGAVAGELPFDSLEIKNFVYQTGVVGPTGLELGQQVPLEVSCTKVDPSSSTWHVTAGLPSASIFIQGAYDAGSTSLSLDLKPMPWNETLLDLVPSRVRAVLAAAKPDGTISRATFVAVRNQVPNVLLSIRGFGAQLPKSMVPSTWVTLCGGLVSPTEGTPALRVDEADAELTATMVRLTSLKGALIAAGTSDLDAEIPIAASGSIDLASLPPVAPGESTSRLSQLLDRAAFSIELDIPGFRLERAGTGSCILLPKGVADALDSLSVTSMAFDLTASLRRDRSDLGATPAPIQSRATILFLDGSLTPPQFPLPLSGIEGIVTVDPDRIDFTRLTAQAPGNASISISGTVEDLAGPPTLDLRIGCQGITITDSLRGAVDAVAGDILDEIFDQESADAIAPAVEAAGYGPFVPGGRAAFQFQVRRSTPTDTPVELRGDLRILQGQVLLRTFPLPLVGTGGLLHFEPDGVTIVEPIQFCSLAGGTGAVGGAVRFTRRDDGLLIGVPDLEFSATGVPANSLLWRAVPPAVRAEYAEWPASPSLEGSILSSLHPLGTFSVSGKVLRFGAEPEFDIVIDVSDASFGPAIDSVAPDHIGWPERLELTDASVRVRITPGRVALERAAGDSCGGRVVAAGIISGDLTDIDIHASELELGHTLEALGLIDPRVPPAWWSSARPVGTLDARVSIEGASTTASVVPTVLEFTLGGERLESRCEKGTISINDQDILIDGLRFLVKDASSDPPSLSDADEAATDPVLVDLTGRVKRASPGDGEWGVTIPQASPASALVRGALREVGAEDLADILQRLGLGLDASAHAAGVGARLERLDIVPTRATVGVGTAHPLTVELSPAARMVIQDGTILSRDLEGRLPGGTLTLGVEGHLGDDSRPGWGRVTVSVAADGSPSLLSLVPEPVRSSLQGLDFEPGQRVSLLAGTVSWEGGSARAEFPVGLTGARIDFGVPIEEYDGLVDVVIDDQDWSVACFPVDACVANTPARLPSALIQGGSDTSAIRARVDVPVGHGMVSGRVTVDEGRWTVDVEASEIPWSDLLRAAGVHTTAPGIVEGRAQVAGGPLSTLAGSGSIRVTEGDFGAPPPDFFNPVRLGSDNRLSELDATLSLDGDTLTIVESELRAGKFRLLGDGSIDLADATINARMRGRSPVPLLGDLVGAVTDTMVQLELRGPVASPESHIVPLPGLLSPRKQP